jgi:hypothetical protein
MNLIAMGYFMNLSDATRNLVILCLSCISVCSEAVIIQGTFAGVVINAGDDSYEDPTYVNYWTENPIETRISGRFQYDTDLAPEVNVGWRKTNASYFSRDVSQPRWLTLEYFIDGRWVKSSRDHTEGFTLVETSKGVGLADTHQSFERPADSFSLVDLHVTQNNEGISESTYSYMAILEPYTDVINGLGLTQNFSWNRAYLGEWGQGTYEVMGEKNGRSYRAWATMDITELTVSPQHSVAEPTSLYLFAIALCGLLLRVAKQAANEKNSPLFRRVERHHNPA